MNNEPLVSVIIPSYNHAQYVVEAITSVLAQSYKNIEIIVIDDGSKDNTKEVLEPYAKEGKINYIYQTNRGLSAARNTGLKAARGHFIKFLDSDDLIYPEQIKKQVEHINDNPHHFSVSDCCFLLPNGKKIVHPYYPPLPEERQLGIFIESNQAPVHAFLTPKQLINKAGMFDETLTACEDWDLWLRILQNGGVAKHCPYVGAGYRILASSMSADMTKMFFQKCRVIEKINNWALSKHTKEDYTFHCIINANTKLVDEGFLRKENIKKTLPLGLFILENALNKQLRNPVKILWKILGTTFFLKIKLEIKKILKKDYAYKLLHEEEDWKFEGGS